jgi:hypothetical protein
MILLVSTFFIGLSALVEQAGAKFKSDAKALELIRQARIAIGGDANINNVRSMIIAGNSTFFFDKNGVSQSEQGTLEISMQLPNQFSKMVRIGNPDTTGNAEIYKQVDVIVLQKDGETRSTVPSGEDNVVIVKDKDGKILTENITPGDGQRKIIIKKDDGSVQELTPGEKGIFTFERKSGDDGAVWNTEDGKKIVINKEFKMESISGNRNNEMLRTTLALLLTAPQGLDVNYTFTGEGSVDGNSCNIIEAQTGGNSFKLFLDKSTFLPRMISFIGMEMPNVIKLDKPVGDGSEKDVKVIVRTSENAPTVEHQVKFSDFRNVGGLLLPHTWAETVGGRQTQNIAITNYEVNPSNIADKFKGQKVFVRKAKDQ